MSNSSNITTKLYEKSACGCNMNSSFGLAEISIFTFPFVTNAWYVGQASVMHVKKNWQDGNAVEFIIFQVYYFVSVELPCQIV